MGEDNADGRGGMSGDGRVRKKQQIQWTLKQSQDSAC